MPLTEAIKLHWRPLAASALVIGLGLVAALLHGHSSLENQRLHKDHYAQAMARSTAQRAVDATLSQDMISLQAILRELTRHPDIVGATIHDLENRLLVQSGVAPAQAERGQFLRYSATVALDENVAGHLQLAVNPPAWSDQDQRFFWVWGLVIFLLASLPWLPGLRKWLEAAPLGTGQTPDPAPLATELSELSEDETAFTSCALRLRLQLSNLTGLFRQLNRESFNEQLGRFERQLRGVLSLYGGQQQALSGDTLLIDFTGESTSDCAFRALCAAQLLRELSHHNPGPRLHLKANIHSLSDPEQHPVPLAQGFALQQESDRGQSDIEIDPELIDSELQMHLELDPDNGTLITIKAPYRQLIDKQLQQLQPLMTASLESEFDTAARA